MLQSLKQMAQSNDCEVGEFELGTEFAIGMTSNERFVFFHKKINDMETNLQVALAEIENCSIHAVKRNVQSKEGNETVIDKLDLHFKLKNLKNEIIKFEFYNSKDHFMLNGEVQLIQKWESKIRSCMSIVQKEYA